MKSPFFGLHFKNILVIEKKIKKYSDTYDEMSNNPVVVEKKRRRFLSRKKSKTGFPQFMTEKLTVIQLFSTKNVAAFFLPLRGCSLRHCGDYD